MLKNLKLRTKLAVVLLAPLVALVAIGTLTVIDRRTVADDAGEDKRVTELLAARVELAHQLQVERVWLSIPEAPTVARSLSTNRASYEAARQAYDRRAEAVRSVDPTLRAALDASASVLATLDRARPADGASGSASTISAYDAALDALANVGVTAARVGGSVARLDRASMIDLAQLKANYSLLWARATMAVSAKLPVAQLDPLRQQLALVEQQERTYLATTSAAARAEYETQSAATKAAATSLSSFLATGPGRVVPADPASWLDAAGTHLGSLRQAEAVLTNSVGHAAESEESKAVTDARNAALAVSAVVLFTLLLASLIARSIARPIGRLTQAANTLADERLPALVDRMRNPSADAAHELVALPVGSRDEVGQLARALDKIQGVTHSVADEQATLLRKGIGDIFVNLARRNQTLLDRQIEFLDQLEASEENPDLLENLFKLDHLATRMRRNAESLLVLAGAEPPRRRGRPIDIADVVRVAVGEVEHFARVQLLALDDATVSGGVAVDVAHLLSELMENATQFSPPDTRVEIVGVRGAAGDYQIIVTDQGIGMTADQLADANDLIANPPPMGLSISRSLGFTVIGRLAQRHALTVQLATSPSGGVAATVVLPAPLLDPVAPAGPPTAAATVPPAIVADPTDVALFAPTAAPTTIGDLFVDPEPPLPHTGDLPVPPVQPPTWADAAPTEPAFAPPPAAFVVDEPSPTSPSFLDDPATTTAATVEPAFAPPPLPPVIPPTLPDLPGAAVPPTVVTAPPPAVSPTPPTDPGAAGSPLPTRAPVIGAAPTAPDLPPHTPAETPTVTPPLPTRRPGTSGVAAAAAGAAAEAAAIAAAADRLEGLTRRVPKVDQGAARPSGGSVRASQRSPEEVRQMLSRYRSGLKKGRNEETLRDSSQDQEP